MDDLLLNKDRERQLYMLLELRLHQKLSKRSDRFCR